jgi:hypothetical protein
MSGARRQQTVNRLGYSSYYLPTAGNLIINGGFSLDRSMRA